MMRANSAAVMAATHGSSGRSRAAPPADSRSRLYGAHGPEGWSSHRRVGRVQGRAWRASKRRRSRAWFGNRRKCLLTSTDPVRTVWHRKALILQASLTSPGVPRSKFRTPRVGRRRQRRTCGTAIRYCLGAATHRGPWVLRSPAVPRALGLFRRRRLRKSAPTRKRRNKKPWVAERWLFES